MDLRKQHQITLIRHIGNAQYWLWGGTRQEFLDHIDSHQDADEMFIYAKIEGDVVRMFQLWPGGYETETFIPLRECVVRTGKIQ